MTLWRQNLPHRGMLCKQGFKCSRKWTILYVDMLPATLTSAPPHHHLSLLAYLFVPCPHHLHPMSLLAHRPLSREPPLGCSKLRGASLCAACSQGVEGLPPSAYSVTRRLRQLLLEEVNLVVSWRPVPRKWKRGRGGRVCCQLFLVLRLMSSSPLPNVSPGPYAPELRASSRPLKIQGSRSLRRAFSGCRGTAPFAYSATRRPRRLLLEEVNPVVSWRADPGKRKRGRGGRVCCQLFLVLLRLMSSSPLPNVSPGP